MTNTVIGNPELASIFEEYGKKGLKKLDTTLYNLYNLDEVQSPIVGEVVSAKYFGKLSGYHLFNVAGYKDSIRVEDKLSENKYLKNSQFNDYIDNCFKSIEDFKILTTNNVVIVDFY